MTTYRTAGPWGAGLGADLSAVQIDTNFWEMHGRILLLEAWPTPAAIDDFVIDGNQLTVLMDDYTTRGPYTLPTYVPTAFVWAPGMNVVAGQMFAQGNTIYTVIYPHLTVDPFDPAENDGGGNDYYQEFITVDGGLPAGGASDLFLIKLSATDYHVGWGHPLPAGGDTGSALLKASGADYHTYWGSPTALPFTRTTISTTTFTLSGAYMAAYIMFSNASGCEITIPTSASDISITLNAEYIIHQGSTGAVTVVAAPGVTLRVPAGFTAQLYGQYATAGLKKVQTNEWHLNGLLQPA